MSIIGPRNALADVAAPTWVNRAMLGAATEPGREFPSAADLLNARGWETGMNPQLAAMLLSAYMNPQAQPQQPPIGARPAPYQMQYVPAERSAFPGGYMWDPRGQAGAAFGAAPPQRAPSMARRPVSREMSADQLNALVLGALGGQAPAAQGSANYGADQNIRRFMGV